MRKLWRRVLPKQIEYEVTSTASGLRLMLPDESDVDPVVAALRKAGGKLVSVQQ